MRKIGIAIVALLSTTFISCEKCWKCTLKDADGNPMTYEQVGNPDNTGEMFVTTCDGKVKDEFQDKVTNFTDTAGVVYATGKYDCAEE